MMLSRIAFAVLFVVLLLAGSAPSSVAQNDGTWWEPVSPRYDQADERGREARRGAPGQARRPSIPQGHLPPEGECKLWVMGQPPGKQGPPMPCRDAARRQRGNEVVVTHTGDLYRPRRGSYDRGWRRERVDDVVIRRPRQDVSVADIGVSILIDILGRTVYDRLQHEQRRLDAPGDLRGRIVEGRDGLVLQVRSGRQPIAEFADGDGDGRVETFLVRENR